MPQGIVDPGRETLLLLVHAGFEPELDQDDAGVHDIFFDLRAKLEETLVFFLAAEAHDVFDTRAIVPTSVEDHDLSCRGKMLDVALEKYLGFFPIGRSGEGHGPEYAWAHFLGESPDCSAFAGGIALL